MPLETTHHNETPVIKTEKTDRDYTNVKKETEEFINPEQFTKEVGPKFVQFLTKQLTENSVQIDTLDTMSEEQLINQMIWFIRIVESAKLPLQEKMNIFKSIEPQINQWAKDHWVSEEKLTEKIMREMDQEQLSEFDTLLNTISE